jgi:hypothetical protein
MPKIRLEAVDYLYRKPIVINLFHSIDDLKDGQHFITVERNKIAYESPDECYIALNYGDNNITYADLRYCQHIKFCDLIDEDLALFYDPTIRTVESLLASFKQNHEGFNEREIVTIVHLVANIDRPTSIELEFRH